MSPSCFYSMKMRRGFFKSRETKVWYEAHGSASLSFLATVANAHSYYRVGLLCINLHNLDMAAKGPFSAFLLPFSGHLNLCSLDFHFFKKSEQLEWHYMKKQHCSDTALELNTVFSAWFSVFRNIFFKKWENSHQSNASSSTVLFFWTKNKDGYWLVSFREKYWMS